MNRLVLTVVSALSGVIGWMSGHAALPAGAKAPDFRIPASLAGEPIEFSLSEALKSGPVVLYFYPAAFTPGCTIEAHRFAVAVDDFKALGATVIGVSTDDLETLHRFSVSECRNKFAVAADADGAVMRAYDAVLPLKPKWSNRTSFVIVPGGEIIYSFTDLKPDQHVANTLKAVRQWRERS